MDGSDRKKEGKGWMDGRTERKMYGRTERMEERMDGLKRRKEWTGWKAATGGMKERLDGWMGEKMVEWVVNELKE